MQHEEGPPAYSEYPTALPDSFPLNAHKVQPLVNVTDLQAHLTLLGAIQRLKRKVQAQEEGVAGTDRDLAWVVFANRAVHRFYIWASSTWKQTSPGMNESIIPPLDVVMAWHSYLLNPRAYYEDSWRMYTEYCLNLVGLQSMPITLISSLIDPQTLEPLAPSTERKAFFEKTTSMTFPMPLITGISDLFTLECPFCSQKNHLVKWIAADKKGFAQTKFEHICEMCGRAFAKPNLGLRRFADEITRKRAGHRVYLSETLLDPRSGAMDTAAADAFTEKAFKTLHEVFKINDRIKAKRIPEETSILAEGLKYDCNILSSYLHTSIRPEDAGDPKAKPIPKIQRLTVAYSHAGLASLDLVGAVLRQGTFIDKMVELGWTRPGRFDHAKDLAPLVRSVARYHAFLDLMGQNPTLFLVPTLDIDLAWHTHQLDGEKYRDDTLKYLYRTPNHDDGVDVFSLSSGYDITAKAWKSRFGVPYSVCGCMPDPDLESRMSKFTSRLSNIGGRKEKSAVRPVNNRPDLVSIEEEEADSSHPSEHNLQFGDPNDPLVKQKQNAREKKMKKCVASAKRSGTRDPWRSLQVERHEKRKVVDHREAFTDPRSSYGHYYPYWGVSMPTPFGFYGGYGYGGGVGGCGGGAGSGGCGAAGGEGGCGGSGDGGTGGGDGGGGDASGCGGGGCGGGCGGGGE